MKGIRDAVVKSLYKFAGDDEHLIQELGRIAGGGGKKAYSIFFNILTQLNLDPETAEACFQEVVAHRDKMKKALGRDVNLRTAICDYFCSIDKILKNPVVVEIHLFESQLNALRYDVLTGLFTRSTFDETLKREISRAKRYGTDLSVLFLDLDNFKKINDTYGHQAGDEVLRKVGQTIKEQVRAEDAPCRYGGEEIVVILPQTGKADGLILGERIRENIAKLEFTGFGESFQVTVSGGLATFPIDAQDPNDLLKCADQALYRAKDFGKNNITVFSHDKRRYLRVNFFSRIKVKQLEFEDDIVALQAEAKNISMAGILFESDIWFRIGSKLQIQIPLTESDSSINILGTVVRVEVFPPDRYDIGVAFLDIDDAVKNILSRYMVRQLESLSAV